MKQTDVWSRIAGGLEGEQCTVTWTHLFVTSELLVLKVTTIIDYFKMKALVRILLFAFYLLWVL